MGQFAGIWFLCILEVIASRARLRGGGRWALSRKDILRIRTRSGIFVVSYCIGGG